MENSKTVYEVSGGAVRVGTGVYIERREDESFLNMLLTRRDVFVITGPRQTGKSSLWVQSAFQLQKRDFNVGTIDFRAVFGTPEKQTRTSDEWTATLLRALTREFGLSIDELKQWMSSYVGATNVNLIADFFTSFLRAHLSGPIIVAMDEIDIVQLYNHFTDNLFETIRAISQKRDELDLSFVLIGLRHPRDLLKIATPASFNISQDMVLGDFDASERTADLWSKQLEIEKRQDRLDVGREILKATGGQPYLTACTFGKARENNVQNSKEAKNLIEILIGQAKSGDWLVAHFSSPSEIILMNSAHSYELLEQYKKIRSKSVSYSSIDSDVRATLLGSGLVKKKEGMIDVKSQFYRAYFDDNWILDQKVRVGNQRNSNYSGAHAFGNVNKKHICLISAGGMIPTELRADNKVGPPHDLRSFYQNFPHLSEIAHIDVVALAHDNGYGILPDHWRLITEAIYHRRASGYSGFVVTCGLQAVPLASSAVAFALGEGLKNPVVFVGARLPTHIVYGDAHINLLRAVKVATSEIPEVVVVSGERVCRAVTLKDQYKYNENLTGRSINDALGTISDEVTINHSLLRSPSKIANITLRNEFSTGILHLSLYSLAKPELILPNLDNPALEGVLLDAFGYDDFTAEDSNGLMALVEKATHRNIPLLISKYSHFQPNLNPKHSDREAKFNSNVIVTNSMSPHTTFVKFAWVISQVSQQIERGDLHQKTKIAAIRTWMNTNLVGELAVECDSGF